MKHRAALILALVSVAAALPQAVTYPIPGLIHRWTLDETSGTAADDSVGAKDGTHTNGPAISTANLPPLIVFSNPACLGFNGTNQYVAITGGLQDVLGGTATLACWVNTTQASAFAEMWQSPGITGVEEAGAGNDIFWGFLDMTGRIGVQAGNGAAALSAAPVNDGQWHHVAMTRDQATGALQMFVDGAAAVAAAGEMGVKTTPFASLGRIEDTGGTPEHFNGRLDDVRIYNRVLTASEVQVLAQGYDGLTAPPGAPTGLTATPGNGQVALSWTSPGGTVSGYRVYRSGPNGGPFTLLTTTTGTTFTDTPVTNGDVWSYYVVAFNSGGESSPSATVSATPVAPPRTNDHDEGLLDGRCACGTSSVPAAAAWVVLVAALLLFLLLRRWPAGGKP